MAVRSCDRDDMWSQQCCADSCCGMLQMTVADAYLQVLPSQLVKVVHAAVAAVSHYTIPTWTSMDNWSWAQPKSGISGMIDTLQTDGPSHIMGHDAHAVRACWLANTFLLCRYQPHHHKLQNK